MITSSGVIMPRSPWLASPGWTKKAGVPVEAKVAAILRATWPDLPMPVTISRPFDRAISSTAATKGVREPAADRRDSAAMPPASVSSVRSADRSAGCTRRVPASRLAFVNSLRGLIS